jgi:hypothetical protein
LAKNTFRGKIKYQELFGELPHGIESCFDEIAPIKIGR